MILATIQYVYRWTYIPISWWDRALTTVISTSSNGVVHINGVDLHPGSQQKENKQNQAFKQMDSRVVICISLIKVFVQGLK